MSRRVLLYLQLVMIVLLSMSNSTTVLAQTFTASNLLGETADSPTSLAFGPDQRLYILELDGTIEIYTITRSAPNNYSVTATEVINSIKNIQNHNDDGTVHVMAERLATGLTVGGTPSNPVIYVTSSDYRQGGLGGGFDIDLDTNSGTISRLTWNGSSWEQVDLVRGLPRSEENHATNGLFLDTGGNTLYVASGGLTNGGSPSLFFAFLCEYALSTCILAVDLTAIDAMPVLTDTSSGADYIYDLPTLDDPTRLNANGIDDPMATGYDGVDQHDPFGGNDGLNQAKLVIGGPVQIYASGFRNAYDVIITQAGKMYTWDNGPNLNWGGHPDNEGVGTATNNYVVGEAGSSGPGPNDPQVNNIDGLHLITGPGYYGGHPNPIRANPDSAGLFTHPSGTNYADGLFRTAYTSNPDSSLPYDWPPVPMSMANPIEGDYQSAGVDDPSIYSHEMSTNGIAEYTATNFDSAMLGDILAVGFIPSGPLIRVNLNATGTVDHPDSVSNIASGFGTFPLDVVAQGDGDAFPGSIWVVTHGIANVTIFEPTDFSACTGVDNNALDEDGDGFTNADEIDNGTSPCNAADMPLDNDGTLIGGFKVSDLNDPDDDDDGINDTLDLFVLDPDNGTSTTLPVNYPLLNSFPATGFYGLGFTGLMASLTDDYLDLWQHENNSNTDIIAGGAAGLLTFVGIDQGDALGGLNDQHNAFDFGIAVDSTTAPFVATIDVFGPVFPDTIQNFQSMGIFAGTGDQDNYVKLVVNANGGTPNLLFVQEESGVATTTTFVVPGIGSEFTLKLSLVINPANGYMKCQYATGGGDPVDLGDGFFLSGSFLTTLKGPEAIAVGIISTARGSTNQFEATWANISVQFDPVTDGQWFTLQDATSCNPTGTPGSCCESRHEASYVQSGDKFYLLGGRENQSNVNIYDPQTDTWTIGAQPPMLLHHFQALDYYGLILVAGAFTGTFPNEPPVHQIMVYDPETDTWYTGPEIPAARRRGSSGAVIHNDTLYLIGGNTMGHNAFYVNWLDKYDLRNHVWTPLSNAPHSRDHFHAAVIGDQIFAAAGRRTGEGGEIWLNTEPTVDYYTLSTQSWDTIATPLPTPRAGNTVALLNGELLVIGGERDDDIFAKVETEALDIGSETWRTLDNLNVGRHGTQAIINNDGIYVASGSIIRGGSAGTNTRTIEAFYFYGPTEPVLNPTVQSTLTSLDLDFAPTDIMDSLEVNLYLDITGGNQAILIQSVSLFDGTAFSIDTNLNFPRFIKPADSLLLRLQFNPQSVGPLEDTLYVQHSGLNAPQTKVLLTGEGVFTWLGSNRAFVDSSAAGPQLGNSWPNAFKELSQAMEVAEEFGQIEEIWIARGIYYPGADRIATFTLVDSVAIYGGFAGTEMSLGQRDIAQNPVILDGNIGVVSDSTDNVYHVITIPASIDTALLDGVIIQGGTANGPIGNQQVGAGIFNLGSATIKECTIRFCGSVINGSAIFAFGSSSILRLNTITIKDNSDPYVVNSGGSTIIWVNAGEIR